MSKSIIIDIEKNRKTKASLINYPISNISDIDHDAKITYEMHEAELTSKEYPIVKIEDFSHYSAIESILPFRVRFKNIGFLGYGPNNPAPIGIAIIGFNNYIL
jgi:hypothetical protein